MHVITWKNIQKKIGFLIMYTKGGQLSREARPNIERKAIKVRNEEAEIFERFCGIE